MLDREERRDRLGPQLYRQRVKVLAALEVLPAEDAYLLRRMFLEGGDVQALRRCGACSWSGALTRPCAGSSARWRSNAV